MEHGDISNTTQPTLAFSVSAFMEPEAKEGSKWWVERIPGDWLEVMGTGWRGLLARAAVSFKPLTEAMPHVKQMEDRNLYKVSCYDVVPKHLQGLVADTMRKHFPTVDLHMADNINDLRALLLRINLDTYYTSNQEVYSRVRYHCKAMYFTGWHEI